MGVFIGRRLLSLVPVLFGIAIIVFALLRFIPGDPATMLLGAEATAAQLRDLQLQLGLNRPLPQQFLEWMSHVFRGDLGTSLFSKRPVVSEIAARVPVSLELAVLATVLSLIVAIPSGIVSAVRRNTIWDQGFLGFALFAVCIPSFLLALLLILAFGVGLGWFPIRGYQPLDEGFLGWLHHMFLPALSYGLIQAAELARVTRSSMIDVLGQDFIRTARSKGLAERRVLYVHGLKNAMIPVVTIIGINIGVLLTSTVVIEYVFGLPGLGSLVIDSIRNRDYPVVQGVLLTIAVAYTLINLLVDVAYVLVDPRVSFE